MSTVPVLILERYKGKLGIADTSPGCINCLGELGFSRAAAAEHGEVRHGEVCHGDTRPG